MNASQLRNMVKQACQKDISTEQAETFLKMFGAELETAILTTQRDFIKHYFLPFGKK